MHATRAGSVSAERVEQGEVGGVTYRVGQGEVAGGGGWDHPQDDMYMVATRLGCQSATGEPIPALATWQA